MFFVLPCWKVAKYESLWAKILVMFLCVFAKFYETRLRTYEQGAVVVYSAGAVVLCSVAAQMATTLTMQCVAVIFTVDAFSERIMSKKRSAIPDEVVLEEVLVG